MEVAGIDESEHVIDYARARARGQNRTNISFGVMDLHGRLDFSDNTFDIIHGRSFSEFLRKPQWMPVLGEILRILRPGGCFAW
ncbi:hypothetical protein KDK_17000 [Dictyobacter kobayashii]|uniref:Methyltransferase domain-containing protein n=1 Tax=Dictyobacter kobayashii TaxID=2014872 RepID=A0A402AFJ8_9CHLR|nr:hypothetical protein KDK_17000 [Dictyobacter kobayashii]